MMRVMTLNINYYGDKHGPWAARREMICNAIRAANPDVIALQAVRADPAVEDGRDQAAQLAADLPEYAYNVFQPAVTENGSASGNAVLSRLEIVDTDWLELTLIPGLEDANQRIVLHAIINLRDGPLHLYNAHFSWVHRQARANVDETIPYTASRGEPGLLVGDLNTPPESELWAKFREAGWTDMWGALHPDEPGCTFEAGQAGLRIDYVWANAEARPHVQDVRIVADEAVGGRHVSDHYGLLTTLDLETWRG
jgi:endonuclease/exonuclease/phosphatase family metal-dependent hydrolase